VTVAARQYGPAVLMTADAVGGVWSYAATLCAALPGIRFVLAVTGPPPGNSRRKSIEQLGNVTLELGPYLLEWMEGAAAELAPSRDWLARLARHRSVDLIHVNGYAHAALDVGVPVLAVAHSDVLSWWAAVHRGPAPARWETYRQEVVTGLHAADRIVAPTGAVRGDLQQHYGIDPRRIEIIPNGIDLNAHAPRPKRPVILAAGRVWDQAKNLVLLDGIAPDLAWPIEIAGDARHPESGTTDLPRVRLLGRLGAAAMARHLGEAAIFAAPARYEPFGLGILEAAAAGCALVLGDIASLRENWDGAALFADPDDREAWRASLSLLIANESARDRLAKAARERAERFTAVGMAERYAALYRDLVRQPAGRAAT